MSQNIGEARAILDAYLTMPAEEFKDWLHRRAGIEDWNSPLQQWFAREGGPALRALGGANE